MKNNIKLDVVFILDKSGSMSGSEEHTISSFNEYLAKEKKNKFNTKITTVLFSHDYEYLHNRVDVSKVKKLTSDDYYVGGCNAQSSKVTCKWTPVEYPVDPILPKQSFIVTGLPTYKPLA